MNEVFTLKHCNQNIWSIFWGTSKVRSWKWKPLPYKNGEYIWGLLEMTILKRFFHLFSHTQLVITLSCAISKQRSHSSKFSFFILCSVDKLVCFSIIPTCSFQILHPYFCWPVCSSIVFITDHVIAAPRPRIFYSYLSIFF